ncbi:MAG: HD domain-containing protein [Lachnospiraceae bacterium]|nr:HD domain-containing protein [Lachnospiraceae bacterium]
MRLFQSDSRRIRIAFFLVGAVTAALCSVLAVLAPQNARTGMAAEEERRNLLSGGSDYTAILYDSANGLPTSEANAIAQTRDGFIWIGGYSGLIRYDGTNFVRFDSSSGIPSVFSLYVDSADRLWIGTNENGVVLYDHGDIRVYGRVETLKSHSVRSITEDGYGNILIATTQGIACIGAADLEIHPIDEPQVNKEYIEELRKGCDGRVYGRTRGGAVFVVENLRLSTFYQPDTFGEDMINAIYPSPMDPSMIYMGTAESELLKVSVDSGMRVTERRSVQPLESIDAILQIENTFWVSGMNGIGMLDGGGRFREVEDLPMSSSIGSIMADHEGNLWFTSTRQGVMKMVPDRFSDLSRIAGLEPAVVNSTCVRDDLLYIGTDEGLIILRLRDHKKVENELTVRLDGIRIRCIKCDTAGNLWICTKGDHGLLCAKKDGSVLELNEDSGLDTNHVRDITERSDGSMAVATTNGLYVVRDGEVTMHYGQESGISTLEILTVEEGGDGKLYLGSDGDGVYVIDDRKVTRIGYEDGLTSGVIMRIKWDEERSMLWLITSNSIQFIKDGVISAVSNFPYMNNYDICFNDHGGAWILSSNGIYVTRVDDLIANGEIEYSFYNTKSGMPYVATGNSRSGLDADGNLYISGTTGVCVVDIDEDENNTEMIRLAIPSIEIDDRLIPIKSGDPIIMPAGSRRLVIDAYALTYGLSNPRLTYYMEGFDEEPVHTTKQEMQPVSYTNLDGGRYTFHLNAIDDETGEIKKAVAVTIIKERSVYESIWFWVILMLVAIFAISTFIFRHFQKRTEALLAKQKENKEFIDEIIHTFARCIDMRDSQNRGHSFRVAYYTKMLAEKLAVRRGYTAEQIDEFHNIALLHDIGKLSIPDRILNKPERLDDEEYVVMKSHAAKGYEILKDVRIVKDLAVGAGCHHERMDGKGYPNGLQGEEIPEVARIIAVADTFDAMYSTRPYRKQLDLQVVLEEIRRIRGTQLDEEVVDALMELAEENMLDKSKVDATIEVAPQLEMMPSSSGNSSGAGAGKVERTREDEEFLDNLGLK